MKSDWKTCAALLAALLACPIMARADDVKEADAKITHGKAVQKAGKELDVKGEQLSGKEGKKLEKTGEKFEKKGKKIERKGRAKKKDAIEDKK